MIDKIFKPVLREVKVLEKSESGEEVSRPSKRALLFDALKHTFSIFAFILVITLILNFLLSEDRIVDFYQSGVISYKFIQPVITAFIGLIPNCAVSLAITVLMIKGTISFGAAMAGLLSNAGLGLLVLLKNNDFKDTAKIILILFIISAISGYLINFII